jgi:hypothetical protein
MKWILKVLRAVIALYLVAAVAVVVFSKLAGGRRSGQIRRFNRDTLNPWMMERAGGEHWYASVVRHVGRTSGREYETPVVMHPVGEHLAIPLPYGTDVDWLENLQHAGGGIAVHKGVEYALTDPVIVSRDAISDALGPRDTVRYRVFGIDDFVQLRAERVKEEALAAV